VLEIAFVLPTAARSDLVASREVVVDALLGLLPAAVAGRSRHMVAAAYMQSMFVMGVPAPDGEFAAAYGFHTHCAGYSMSVTVRFVQSCSKIEPVQLQCSLDTIASLPSDPSVGLETVPRDALRWVQNAALAPRPQACAPASVAASAAGGYTGKLWEMVTAGKQRVTLCAQSMCPCSPPPDEHL
jgi:hypothetical protein